MIVCPIRAGSGHELVFPGLTRALTVAPSTIRVSGVRTNHLSFLQFEGQTIDIYIYYGQTDHRYQESKLNCHTRPSARCQQDLPAR